MTHPSQPGTWVLLSYRLPREPSTPRITIWRKLKRLGVAQIADGVVALPADARTREHLEWIAEEITDAHGSAVIWLAQPTTLAAERDLATTMATARTAEYTHVIAEAIAAVHREAPERAAAARRLRAELRRIQRRDYFPPTQRETARRAVQNLTDPDPERLVRAEERS
jgi:DNA-binding transcriptional regulator PaaX